MDTKELLNAKKELENRLLVVISKELDSFHAKTGLVIDEVKVTIAQFETADGKIGSVWPEKVTCKILL
jgi:hypothetical protein